ncbi:MAG: hypothetical protein EOO54_16095 [Haliea sp.]|nr:MAG: hypothetical protein EOO54_16095 [Haliea sp.]
MLRILPLLIAVTAASVQAGAPDKLAIAAGPQPSQAQARKAVVESLRHSLQEPRDLERVRFFSGPHLVTGLNFANGREQAWMMCVVEGDARPSRGPLDLELRPYLLRNGSQGVTVVENANWSDFDNRC